MQTCRTGSSKALYRGEDYAGITWVDGGNDARSHSAGGAKRGDDRLSTKTTRLSPTETHATTHTAASSTTTAAQATGAAGDYSDRIDDEAFDFQCQSHFGQRRDEVTSEGTKDLIWQELFRISTLVRYYARVGSFRAKCQTASQVILFVSSAGAFGAVMDLLPDIVGVICSLAIAAVAVASITWNHPTKIAAILAASSGCRKAESAATMLWQDAERLSDTEALSKWQSLEDEIEAVTGPVEKAGIGYSERLSVRCAKEAKQVMAWAPTSGTATAP